MDAARYMAPALQNFAKMIIPLSEPVPRRLVVTTPRARSSSRSASLGPRLAILFQLENDKNLHDF